MPKFINTVNPELSFFVDDCTKKFNKGVYKTTDEKEIAILKKIANVTEEKVAPVK